MYMQVDLAASFTTRFASLVLENSQESWPELLGILVHQHFHGVLLNLVYLVFLTRCGYCGTTRWPYLYQTEA
jgi:hypothetical protein